MRKRVLSVLMTLCMVLTLLPVSALAAETKNPIVSTIEKFDEVYNGGRGTFRATESGNTVICYYGNCISMGLGNHYFTIQKVVHFNTYLKIVILLP